jgi:hypothetical protein
MMRRTLAVAVLALAVAPLGAQKPSRCLVELLGQPRMLRREELFGGNFMYTVAPDVQMRCTNQNVRLWTDSLTDLNDKVYRLMGHARYRDDDYELTADTVVYTLSIEELQAVGHVVVTDLHAGSTLRSPHVVYLRAAKGVRDSGDVQATERPVVRYFPRRTRTDTAHAIPYLLSADFLHGFGQSRLWGGGKVTVDRDSLHGRSDSLSFLSGSSGMAQLIGKPATLWREGPDSVSVAGREIRFDLDQDTLRSLRAFGAARVQRADTRILSDTVSLAFTAEKLEQTLAWNHTAGAALHSGGYDVTGDSIAVDTPGEQLRQLRVFGRARVQNPLDSTRMVQIAPDTVRRDTTSLPNRDTLWGSRMIAAFFQVDSAGRKVTRLQQIEATGQAASYFTRSITKNGATSPAINYTRADTILVTMRQGDSTGVSDVRARGHVDGVNLETADRSKVPPDSVRDTTRVPMVRRP